MIWGVNKENEMKNFLNRLFYICITGTVLIFFIPQKYHFAVYSLSIIGWIWVLFFIPFTFIAFVVGGMLNFKDQEWKPIKKRSIILGILMVFYAFYWFFRVYINM